MLKDVHTSKKCIVIIGVLCYNIYISARKKEIPIMISICTKYPEKMIESTVNMGLIESKTMLKELGILSTCIQ